MGWLRKEFDALGVPFPRRPNLPDPKPSDVSELVGLGINELVLVESPPEHPRDAASWVATLADQWVPTI